MKDLCKSTSPMMQATNLDSGIVRTVHVQNVNEQDAARPFGKHGVFPSFSTSRGRGTRRRSFEHVQRRSIVKAHRSI